MSKIDSTAESASHEMEQEDEIMSEINPLPASSTALSGDHDLHMVKQVVGRELPDS
jgi:hypothetical protein